MSEAEFGAIPGPDGTRFRVWAPDATRVEVVPDDGRPRVPLVPEGRGIHAGVAAMAAGERYRLSTDAGPPMPDPASRWQPEGVHGPSAIVDPARFEWSDEGWEGVPLQDLVLYELHVGTFTPEGTFEAAAGRFDELRNLGVTGIELMPLADFPGRRNWGYDGGALFAPANAYGSPDDLRRLVDAAHAMGLAVHLDVVYNHFGPDGAYAAAFSRRFFSPRHRSPWGAGINLDDADSDLARGFFIANAIHWVREYHMDGLRIDATHAMVDDGPRHFVAEMAARVREAAGSREVLVIAEDARNLAQLVKPESAGGWGLDAVWSDDFHHEMRRLLAGDAEGYFADFRGDVGDLVEILRHGWLYTGQYSVYAGHPRGTDPAGVAPSRFVFFLQNHDQVGNRALGERLNHQIDPAAYRAAAAVLLLAPQTPLLFMGQEWGASAPFRFFTDHEPALGQLVTSGRRDEFRRFPSFASEQARGRIPDPQAAATFEDSRLDWCECDREPHASLWRLHQSLLALRRVEPALAGGPGAAFEVETLDEGTLAMRREDETGEALVLVARLIGSGAVTVPAALLHGAPTRAWIARLGTEDPEFAPDPVPPGLQATPEGCRVHFHRPGAIVLGPAGSHP